MNWSDDEVETLKKLWGEGVPSGTIAKQLNKTRSSVMGKVNRIGLMHDAQHNAISLPNNPPDNTKFQPRRPLVQQATTPNVRWNYLKKRPAPLPRHQVLYLDDTQPGISILKIGFGQCRYPLTDPRDENFRFCGEPVAHETKSYCEAHCKRVYQNWSGYQAYIPPRKKR